MNLPTVIAITGGPCAGKTTFMALAQQWLEKHGIHVIVLSETATELINAGFSPAILGFNKFQEELLIYSLKREDYYRTLSHNLKGWRKVVILCDRGVFDSAAYIGKPNFMALIDLFGYKMHDLLNRYKMALHLVSTALGAEDHYTRTNNSARSEDVAAARALEFKTQDAWMGHPHHVLIDNSTDFETKMNRALGALARVLDMPEPTEIERKFRVFNFTKDSIPSDAVVIEITQDYLMRHGPVERRVRKYSFGGGSSFYYTEKSPTNEPAVRIERERIITEEEYFRFLEERDPKLTTIKKTRYCFSFEGRRLELDVYTSGKTKGMGLVILEIELQELNEQIILPPWKTEEVTGQPQYSNYQLAQL